MTLTAARAEAAILELLAGRGGKTACPSEVARRLAPTAWRPLMPAVRAAAAALQVRGLIDVLQRGQVVAAATARGPIRLRLCPGLRPEPV